MSLKVKTLRGVVRYETPPNGGWGWVVVLASFFIFGNGLGTGKSLGIFYLDIKFEFDANNSDTSWISSLFLGALGLAGFFNSILTQWLDARMTIMIGGLCACVGLLISAFSSTLVPIYIGSLIAGLGHGLAIISCTAQLALYFGSLRPLANGIALCGASLCAAALPYLNNYLLKVYGWRGSFFILAGMSLQTCMLGALVRPMSTYTVSEKSSNKLTGTEISQDACCVASESGPSFSTRTRSKKSICGIFKTYWVAFSLLGCNILSGFALFVPNIYLVPYCKSLGYSSDDCAMLLSLISVGDIICRPVCGMVITRIKKVSNNLLFFISLVILSISVNQLLAVFADNLSFLIVYAVLHGCFFGIFTTTCLTAISSLMGTKNIARYIGLFFSTGSLAIFASGPIAGALVDQLGGYEVSYWYSLLCTSATAVLVLVFHVIVKIRGGVVVQEKIPQEESKKESLN